MGFGRYRFRRSFGNVKSQFRGARFDTYPLFSGLLDDYPSAAAAYSLRALSSAWLAGDVVEVRRSSDSTTQSFTASQITNGDLETFCGVGDGFVSTWYDQSGNGNDATQATTTAQPKIVDAGSLVVGGLDFDGVDDVLSITSSITPASFFAVASHGGGAFNRVISNGVGTSAIIANPTSYLTRFGNTTGRNMGASTTSQVLATAIDSGSSDLCGLNGATGSSGDFGSFASDSYAISSNGGWDGNINEVIIYDSDQSANRVGIETNINDFYGIY